MQTTQIDLVQRSCVSVDAAIPTAIRYLPVGVEFERREAAQ